MFDRGGSCGVLSTVVIVGDGFGGSLAGRGGEVDIRGEEGAFGGSLAGLGGEIEVRRDGSIEVAPSSMFPIV